jgi:hypothetical protein
MNLLVKTFEQKIEEETEKCIEGFVKDSQNSIAIGFGLAYNHLLENVVPKICEDYLNFVEETTIIIQAVGMIEIRMRISVEKKC